MLPSPAWPWWGQNDSVPAPETGPVDVGLKEHQWLPWAEACLYNSYFFANSICSCFIFFNSFSCSDANRDAIFVIYSCLVLSLTRFLHDAVVSNKKCFNENKIDIKTILLV